jgi:hypothetical protein
MDLFRKLFGEKSADELYAELGKVNGEILALERRLERIPVEVRAEAFDDKKCATLEAEEEQGKLTLRRLQGQQQQLEREYRAKRDAEEEAAAIELAIHALENLDRPIARLEALHSEFAALKALLHNRVTQMGAAYTTAARAGRLAELPHAAEVEVRLSRAAQLLRDDRIRTRLPRPPRGPEDGETRRVYDETSPPGGRLEVYRDGEWVPNNAVQARRGGLIHPGHGRIQ